MLNDNCYAVIMAGGAGTRLWPLSSRDVPKHFLRLFGGKSLIELTVDKLCGQVPNDRIVILTSVKYRSAVQRTLPQIPAQNLIYEPCLRDTASAIGLAATVLQERCAAATMIVLTADQIIEPAEKFNQALADATAFLELQPGQLVAFGVPAASPSTLVGWQKLGEKFDFPDCEVRRITAFTEKPAQDVARRFLDEGGYCWNSGQFAWKAGTILEELARHLPATTAPLAKIAAAWNGPERDRVLADTYPEMPQGSIDYQVMQKTDKACSILLPCSWEDMGTHAALAARIASPRGDNLVLGQAVVQGAKNVVLSNTHSHVVVAADNLTVVVTDHVVFIGDRNTDMKALMKHLAEQAPEIV